MTDQHAINGLIAFAFSKSIYINAEQRALINERYPAELVEHMDRILKDSCHPSEPWINASSLSAAANEVEPVLRRKYPELDDASIEKVMNFACFSWK